MRFRRGILIVGLLAAALGEGAVGVHGSSAAPTQAITGASTIDKTYSCRVRRQHYVDLDASATLPPIDQQPQPGVLVLTTGVKTTTQNGVTTTVSQISLRAVKNSLRIDTSSCRRLKQQIPLKPKGLLGPVTATPTQFGRINERCVTAARVLVRLRLETTNHTPSHALLAIRNDNAKRRPIAFYNWKPRKVIAYTGKSCVSTS